MLSGIIGNIRWFMILAMLGGPALSFFSFQDGQRYQNLKENGVTVSAYIESAVEISRRRSGKSYEVDLTWVDANGDTRSASGVNITREFAGNIIEGNTLMVDNLDVLYLPGDASVEPAVAGDLTAQIEQAGLMVKLGIGAGIIGLIGTILFFTVGRRRKEPVPA